MSKKTVRQVANCVDPDQKPCSAEPDLGLLFAHACLSQFLVRFIWVLFNNLLVILGRCLYMAGSLMLTSGMLPH